MQEQRLGKDRFLYRFIIEQKTFEKIILSDSLVNFPVETFFTFTKSTFEILRKYKIHTLKDLASVSCYRFNDEIIVKEITAQFLEFNNNFKNKININQLISNFVKNTNKIFEFAEIKQKISNLTLRDLNNYIDEIGGLISISDNYYLPFKTIKITNEENEQLFNSINRVIKKSGYITFQRLYKEILTFYYPEILEKNNLSNLHDANSFVKNLFNDKLQFLDYSIIPLGAEIKKPINFLFEKFENITKIKISDIVDYTKENYLNIGNIGNLLNDFYNKGFIRLDSETLYIYNKLLIDDIFIEKVEKIIIDNLFRGQLLTAEIVDYKTFPLFTAPWNEHLLAHILMRNSNKLEVVTLGNDYRYITYKIKEKKMYKWYFPRSNYGQRNGLKDSGIETFKGALLDSLTREIIQNSLDAKLEDETTVIIHFDYFDLPTANFPDKEGFLENVRKSISHSEKLNDKSTMEFFQKAEKVLQQPTIPFLRISDFNTTGLVGSNSDSASDWNHLVRYAGASDKAASAGGSFGIGKNATFACSDLHTVFYSTLDKNGEIASEGVSKLISIPIAGIDDYTQGTCYYAINEKHDPIRNQAHFDNGFVRENSGTDIYIAGFSFTKDEYKQAVINNLLDNFLYAIYQGTLEVKINDKYINKETLEEVVSLNGSELKAETVELMELITSPDTIWHNDFFEGEASLGLLVDVNGSRKISAIRKPWMKITSFDGFSRAVDFKGVFIAHGNRLNERLRRLENPRHDAWEVDRLPESERKNGQKLLTDIRKFIADGILKLIDLDDTTSLEMIGASDFIKLIDDDKTKKQKKVKEEISSVSVEEKNYLKSINDLNSIGEDTMVDDGGDEEPLFEEEINLGRHRRGVNPFRKVESVIKGRKISINNNQVKLARISKDGDYKLFYRANNEESVITVVLKALDEEGTKLNIPLDIISAKQGDKDLKINNNQIVDCKLENGVLNINLKLKINSLISLGVDIYEVK